MVLRRLVYNRRSPLNEGSAEDDVAGMTAKMDATFENSGVISQKAVWMQYVDNFCRCLYWLFDMCFLESTEQALVCLK